MSYNITITTTGGQHTVTTSGQVPDGSHSVSGHADDHGSNLAVARMLPGGQVVAQTGSNYSKEA